MILAAGLVGAMALNQADQEALAWAVAAIMVVALIAVGVVSSALSQIFRIAVFQYVATGETSTNFGKSSLDSAFE